MAPVRSTSVHSRLHVPDIGCTRSALLIGSNQNAADMVLQSALMMGGFTNVNLVPNGTLNYMGMPSANGSSLLLSLTGRSAAAAWLMPATPLRTSSSSSEVKRCP